MQKQLCGWPAAVVCTLSRIHTNLDHHEQGGKFSQCYQQGAKSTLGQCTRCIPLFLIQASGMTQGGPKVFGFEF
jgi:hypothetical protein